MVVTSHMKLPVKHEAGRNQHRATDEEAWLYRQQPLNRVYKVSYSVT